MSSTETMTEQAEQRGGGLLSLLSRARRSWEGSLRRHRRKLLGLGLTLLAGLALIWALLPDPLIDPARFVRPLDSTEVLDRGGAPLRYLRTAGEDRRWVPLEEISEHLREAVVATEDQRFFEHSGVDPWAIGRALFFNLLPGHRLSGASTLTQQLVKLVYGRPLGYLSKGTEAARAVALERTFSKEQILEQYLNRVPFGDRIVGVGRASEAYFGRSAAELSLGQAALLAGVPQAPSATEPRRHLARALRRRRLVLWRMLEEGYIDREAHDRAVREPPRIRATEARPYRAPRFVDRALARRPRSAPAADPSSLEESPGRLRTSLDLPLQRRSEELLRAAVREHASRGAQNGAAVVVSVHSGEILAYVGAALRGADQPAGQMDLLRARRQPGSTLKPFVYELFFERGGSPASVLADIRVPMTGAGGSLFVAEDYDGRERGPVRARVALASSLNLAALDAAREVGAEAIVERLGQLGIGELADPRRYGAAIVLGGVEIAPIELAEAYLALARRGTHLPLSELPADPRYGERVMEEGAAWLARDILYDAEARRAAFGGDLLELNDGRPFALKTGTSSGWHDAWAATFDEDVLALVWLGDPAGGALAEVSGFEAAAPVAARLLREGRLRAEALGLTRPPAASPLVSARICAHSGLLVGPRCAHPLTERFVPEHLPTERCAAHSEEGTDLLPPRYAEWLRRERPTGLAVEAPEADPGHPERPRMSHPADGARLLYDARRPGSSVPLRATYRGGSAVGARFLVDGEPIEGDRWVLTPGDHELTAVVGELRSEPARVVVQRGG